jgi:hypothetical protein
MTTVAKAVPSAAWSQLVPAQTRTLVQRAIEEMLRLDIYAADYGERAIVAIQNIGRAWGGQCLSPDYEGSKVPLGFECAAGHRFQLSIVVLRRGGWCQACHYTRATVHSIDEARTLAAQHGGLCLSTSYQNGRAKLRWRCAAGHEWRANFEGVLRGDWCQACHFERIKPRQEDIERAAVERGGRCLSAYVDKETSLDWQCAEGHTWSAPWFRVSKGQWCHRCAVKARTRTIEQMQDLAKSRGGRCLSTAYPGVHGKLELECAKGHLWKATVNSVWRGSWCPECAWESRRMARNRRRSKGAVPIRL